MATHIATVGARDVSSAFAWRAATGELHVRSQSPLRTRPPKTSRTCPNVPTTTRCCKLYALYKQGSEGDVSGPKPGFFDFVGTAKYEAWAKLKGTKGDEAMQKYVDLVKKLGG